ncbi:MAG: type II 3-dehydroquinate dehydratase [Lysobacterales bacterium]
MILLLNGPNLDLLGTREPERYGHATLAEIVADVSRRAELSGSRFEHLQSNSELALIERLHAARGDATRAIIINPGGLTHSSVALRDALVACGKPFFEVHLSNVFAREAFRHRSLLSDVAAGVIVGMGALGYGLALVAALKVADVASPADTAHPAPKLES